MGPYIWISYICFLNFIFDILAILFPFLHVILVRLSPVFIKGSLTWLDLTGTSHSFAAYFAQYLLLFYGLSTLATKLPKTATNRFRKRQRQQSRRFRQQSVAVSGNNVAVFVDYRPSFGNNLLTATICCRFGRLQSPKTAAKCHRFGQQCCRFGQLYCRFRVTLLLVWTGL